MWLVGVSHRFYESRHWIIEAPDAPDILHDQTARKGLKQADLAAVIGSNARASKTLNRRRYLTPQQAWNIHVAWRIPAEAAMSPYPLMVF